MLSRVIPELRLLSASNCFTQKCYVHHHKERHDLERFLGIKRSNPAKANRNTHINEKRFRRARAAKTMIIDLPEDSELRESDKLGPNELRLNFLRKGINPYKDVAPRTWSEHQSTFQSFYGVIDPFIKPSYVVKTDPNPPATKKPLQERIKEQISHVYHDWRGVKRIQKKEGLQKFSKKALPDVLDNIYINAYKALTSRNKNELHHLVTEHAFAKMWPDVENGSVIWELVKFNEPTQIVSVRCSDNPHKSGNDIAQVTARINSTQKLAIFDRFGKLILGSETEEKDVLEFVVFESHVSSVDSVWRLHGRVFPSGIPPKEGPIDKKIIESLPEDEYLRPSRSVELKLRVDEHTKKELKEKETEAK